MAIHKSQGKTFEKVIIDFGTNVFAGGQVYVALSRATSLEGVYLKRAIRLIDILVDFLIKKYVIKENITHLIKVTHPEICIHKITSIYIKTTE